MHIGNKIYSTSGQMILNKWSRLWALLFVFLFVCAGTTAQTNTGTISGTVFDRNNAVIPNAEVKLVNTATNDTRTTASNGSGFFNFAAVQVGTYKVVIAAPGFRNYVATDIVMHALETHAIPDIAMAVAGDQTSVEVVASQAGIIPTDSGVSSTTISNELVENLSVTGRNAAELVKFMPGMGMNNGLGQTQWSSFTTSTNSGPIGSFSANGTQPYGSMQMTLDGAGLIDIGNMGTQIANVNQDVTAEFTYLNAAFGADTPRGPTIIQVTSKSGGQKFHGDAYIYGRNWQMDAEDAYLKANNVSKSTSANHQWYPGGTIGGPVIFPGTHFNHNRNKLFFFAGYEKMFQNPAPTPHFLVTPTQDMLNGDFRASKIPGNLSSSSQWWDSAKVPCTNAPNWTSYCATGSTQAGLADWNNGLLVNRSIIDPDGLAMLSYLNKINPPNIDPAANNGYNFEFLDKQPVNRWELRLRGDFNPTEKDKFSVVYTHQNEADNTTFGIWWWPGSTAPMPSQLGAETLSRLWTVNYTRVFSPTVTNEASFSYSYFTFPPRFLNSNAMSASTAGYTNVNPFGLPPAMSFDQIPNLISWNGNTSNNNGSFSSIYAPPMIKSFGNAYGNQKRIWSWQDNFTKILGRHSLKAGFFWDEGRQLQTNGYGSWPQGMIEFDSWGTYTTGNQFADELIGHVQSAVQAQDAPSHDVLYHEWAIYVQDSWHATSKLTLNYGVRFDHDGQWYPLKGNGMSVWNPDVYGKDSNNDSGTPNVQWPGIRWNEIQSNIPRSGFVSRLLVPDPRVGGAYDFHGNGQTVLRGGFGIYRWQFSEGDVDSAFGPSWNVQSLTTGGTQSFAALKNFAPSTGTWCALPQGADPALPNSAYGGAACPTGVDAIKMGEDKTPYTMNWDVLLDQVLPGHMKFELQYIGNATRDALLTGNGSTENFYSNINKIPYGAFWGTYHLAGAPNDGQNLWQMSCATGQCGTSNNYYLSGYRPYKNYGVLNVVQHGSYSNYHGMVAALEKQTGRYTFLVNYTYSKVLGIRDGQSDNGGGDGTMVDPFNLRNNYGVLSYDHTHIFNAAYVIHLPNVKSQEWANYITSGWDLSGGTQVQSGAPIQPNTQGQLNVQWLQSNSSASGKAFTPGNNYMLGTNAIVLLPYISCDPRQAGKSFNVNCFTTPTTFGVNGQAIWPYIHGPKYFNSDLALARSFRITETQNVQFRYSAFNFLNHPLPTFNQASDVNLKMSCASSTQNALQPTCDQGGLNTNPQTTGNPFYKTGSRRMEVSLKYIF